MSDMAAVNIKANPVSIGLAVVLALLLGAWALGFFSSGPQVNMRELLSASIDVARQGGDAVKKIREDGELDEQVKGKTKEGALELKSNGDMASHHIMYYGLMKAFPDIHVESEEHDKKAPAMSSVVNALKSLKEVDSVGDVYVAAEDITVWVDPLDATQEYTENLKEYVTTMVCVAVKGKPTIGVIHRAFSKETYWAYLDHGHSANLNPKVHAHEDNEYTMIVSRSHSGTVEDVAKKSMGDNTKVVSAGGAGYKTLEVISGNVDAYVHVTAIKKWDICAGNAIIKELGGKQTTLKGEEIDYSASGSPANTDGLLLTLKDHDTYLSAFRPVFEEQQKQQAQSRGKREEPAGEIEVESDKKVVANYKTANREA